MSFPITEANHRAEKNRVEELWEDAQGHWATLSGQALQATVAKTGGTNEKCRRHVHALVSAFPISALQSQKQDCVLTAAHGTGDNQRPELKIRPCLNHTDYGFLQLICKQDRGFRKAPHTSVGSYTEFAWVKRKPSVPSHLAIQRWRLCDRAKLLQQMVYCTRDRGAQREQTRRALCILVTSLHPRVKKTYCVRSHGQDPPPCLSR